MSLSRKLIPLCYVIIRFGLFEAMSAIEIMDPKMDAGMVCNRKRTVLQIDEAISVCIVAKLQRNCSSSNCSSILFKTKNILSEKDTTEMICKTIYRCKIINMYLCFAK